MDPLFPQIPEKLSEVSDADIAQLLSDHEAAAALIDSDDQEFLKGLTADEIIEQYAKGRAQAEQWSERFFGASGWHPPHAAVFAGALRSRHYNFLMRLLMKCIARSEGMSTDTSRNHEYTDWRAVERFADELAGL